MSKIFTSQTSNKLSLLLIRKYPAIFCVYYCILEIVSVFGSSQSNLSATGRENMPMSIGCQFELWNQQLNEYDELSNLLKLNLENRTQIQKKIDLLMGEFCQQGAKIFEIFHQDSLVLSGLNYSSLTSYLDEFIRVFREQKDFHIVADWLEAQSSRWPKGPCEDSERIKISYPFFFAVLLFYQIDHKKELISIFEERPFSHFFWQFLAGLESIYCHDKQTENSFPMDRLFALNSYFYKWLPVWFPVEFNFFRLDYSFFDKVMEILKNDHGVNYFKYLTITVDWAIKYGDEKFFDLFALMKQENFLSHSVASVMGEPQEYKNNHPLLNYTTVLDKIFYQSFCNLHVSLGSRKIFKSILHEESITIPFCIFLLSSYELAGREPFLHNFFREQLLLRLSRFFLKELSLTIDTILNQDFEIKEAVLVILEAGIALQEKSNPDYEEHGCGIERYLNVATTTKKLTLHNLLDRPTREHWINCLKEHHFVRNLPRGKLLTEEIQTIVDFMALQVLITQRQKVSLFSAFYKKSETSVFNSQTENSAFPSKLLGSYGTQNPLFDPNLIGLIGEFGLPAPFLKEENINEKALCLSKKNLH